MFTRQAVFIFFLTLQNISIYYLSKANIYWLLIVFLPPVPLQDEKNQVLITNAWLQLVRLVSEHFFV